MQKRVIIIGGGVAGTAAAYALHKRGYETVVIEQNDRLGGRVYSVRMDGAAVEMGAGFVSKFYTNVHTFLRESGLNQQLRRQHGSSGIIRSGDVKMATLGTLAGNDTLSWAAKLQTLRFITRVVKHWRQLDVHALWRAAEYDDRSVVDMFHGRGSKEFLEYLLQPALNGYLYWTPEQTSQAIMLAIGKALFNHRTYIMQGGLQQIPETAAKGSEILLGRTVKNVHYNDESYTITIAHKGKQSTLHANGIVCATTATAVPKIFPGLTPKQRNFFNAISYSSTALVARTYRQAQTWGSKGIAFPRREKINLAAVTVTPEPGGPQPVSSVKAYASGTVGKQLCKGPDSQIATALISYMQPVRSVVLREGEHMSIHVQRWPEALPIFEPGHLKRLRAFTEGSIEDPNTPLVFAGDYIGGPSIEGAFTSGIQAAERLDRCFGN